MYNNVNISLLVPYTRILEDHRMEHLLEVSSLILVLSQGIFSSSIEVLAGTLIQIFFESLDLEVRNSSYGCSNSTGES